MPNILLINPNPNELIKPTSFNLVQPNALLAIGSALKNAGFTLKILDMRLSSDIQKDIREALNEGLLFVGITMMTTQVRQSLKILEIIKKINPQMPIVVGGVHPSLFPEQVLQESKIDFCVMFEGEETVAELAQQLKNNTQQFDLIKGLGYKKNGNICINQKRENIPMDNLPLFDWDLVNMESYISTKMSLIGERRSVNIQSSRGCPFRCAFCINVCLKETWRAKSAERVLKEVAIAQEKLNINFVYFRDENFFVQKDRILAIAQGMKKMNIEWCAAIRANYFNEKMISLEMLAVLDKCRLRMVGIGAESGSQRILDKISKGIKVDDIIQAAEYLSTTSIVGMFSFLTGIPTETKEELYATLDIIKKIQKINKRIILGGPQIFRPYPGGTLYEECVCFGLKAPTSLQEWALMDLLETRGSFPIEKMPWIKEKNLTLAVNEYVVMASFPLSQFGFSLRGLMVLISKIRYALNFFAFPFEYKLYYKMQYYVSLIKKSIASKHHTEQYE